MGVNIYQLGDYLGSKGWHCKFGLRVVWHFRDSDLDLLKKDAYLILLYSDRIAISARLAHRMHEADDDSNRYSDSRSKGRRGICQR